MSELPETLPPKPQAPAGYDCCGGGCADCELRIYQRELARWLKLEAAMIAAGKLPAAYSPSPGGEVGQNVQNK